MEIQNENQLNFLHITITKDQNKCNYKIYRNPIKTDVIFNAQSHHSRTQKNGSL